MQPAPSSNETCRLAGLNGQAVVQPELHEWNYGDYEGLTSAEIRRAVPDWNLFSDGCPNGESPEQMVTRIDGVIDQLRSTEGIIALVAHGHFLRVLTVRWLGLNIRSAERFQLGTASISILGGDGSLHLWNDSGSSVSQFLSPQSFRVSPAPRSTA